jgi:NADH dehydrogenase
MFRGKVLVVGGAGFIGRHVVERLVASGRSVLVPARRRERAKHLIVLPTVEAVEADVNDPATLGRLVDGQQAVINLVGVLHGSSAGRGAAYGPEFLQAHVELPRRIAAACGKHGIGRLVHVSALGADPKGPSMYLRSKGDGERVVLASKAIATTVFRPSVVFGREDRFLNAFAHLAAFLPVVPVAAPAARFQPVWVEDVAAAIVNSLDDDTTFGRTYELCGPRIYTLKELVEFAVRASGRKRPVIGLPGPLGRAMAAVMALAPGEPLLTRDNLDSMKVDNVASRQPFWPAPELGIRPTPMEPEAALYLAGLHPRTRFSGFRTRARR